MKPIGLLRRTPDSRRALRDRPDFALDLFARLARQDSTIDQEVAASGHQIAGDSTFDTRDRDARLAAERMKDLAQPRVLFGEKRYQPSSGDDSIPAQFRRARTRTPASHTNVWP